MVKNSVGESRMTYTFSVLLFCKLELKYDFFTVVTIIFTYNWKSFRIRDETSKKKNVNNKSEISNCEFYKLDYLASAETKWRIRENKAPYIQLMLIPIRFELK